MSDIEIYFPLFLQLFKGREEFFAQQGIDYYHPVNKSLNEYYLAHHLNGDATFGIYLLDKDSYCHLFCFDLDIPKSELESIYVNDTQNKYHRLAPQLNGLLSILIDKYKIPNEAILVEDTGGRGFHIWVFLSHAIPGSLAIVFGENIKKQVEFTFEFYPKQGRLTAKRKYGNLIKLPLGIHRTYQSRSRFITLSPEGPVVIDTLDANLELLTRIEPADSLLISSAADTFQVELQLRDEFISDATRESQRNQYLGDPSTLVSRCTAIRLLSEKAESGIPFNQKEAFHFANIMLSTSGGVNEIHRVMKLSYGEKYNPARTNSEIENILPLFPSSCRTLVDDSICPQYCKQSVKKNKMKIHF